MVTELTFRTCCHLGRDPANGEHLGMLVEQTLTQIVPEEEEEGEGEEEEEEAGHGAMRVEEEQEEQGRLSY